MRWEPKGKMALVCGDWIIAKYRLEGDFVYVLWHNFNRIGQFRTATAAKLAAERLT